ncbi:MAG TPA: hypothetical protein VMV94_10125 [Phycisphaerae bacterium]|nr:hypothetical protein [Phycisphaerae bacterium]
MLPHRKYLLILTIVLVGGSLGWTAAYGLRLRSESYRASVEDKLSRFFDLPCNLGGIRGHTFASRAFENVEVWLPGRRDRIFRCDQAIWWEKHRDDRASNELELNKGLLLLGTDRWRGDDYGQVFRSGLGHNFEDLDLTQVKLSDFEIGFDRGGVSIRCRDTSGLIDMSNPKDGVAHLVAYELGGHRVSQGVRIEARFLPQNGVDVSEFILMLPEVPLASIGISSVLGSRVSTGQFAGRVQYRKTADEPEIWLDGRLEDADLAELTAALPLGPFPGRFSVSVDGAKITGSTVTHFLGRGRLSGLSLSPFGPLVGRSSLSGSASFNFDSVDLALGHINRLRLEGTVSDLVLEEWLQLLGHGSATGRLVIRVNNLDVVDDRVRSADIEINALPPADAPGTIDRDLLLEAAEKAFDFSWPPSLPRELLPDKVEYAELGMRLLVRDNHLRILGTHGADGDTILTIKLLGTPVAVVKEQPATIDLTPVLGDLLAAARAYDPAQMRDWWRSHMKRGEPPQR